METYFFIFMVFIVFAMIAGVFSLVIYFIKKSTPYKESLSLAEKDLNVLQYTGHPIKVGFLVLGTFETKNGDGKASITIPISGPVGSGNIYVKANRALGVWTYQSLTFVPKGANLSIDLLNK